MKYVSVNTGDQLQRVAAKYLGDATMWVYIAKANGLFDSQIQGLQTILIPNVPPSLTGGILK